MIEVYCYKAKTIRGSWFYGYCKLEEDGTRNPICDRNGYLISMYGFGSARGEIHKDILLLNTICLADDSLPGSPVNAFEGDICKVGEYYYSEDKIRNKMPLESEEEYQFYIDDCFDLAVPIEILREIVFEDGKFKFKGQDKPNYNIGFFRNRTYEDTLDDYFEVIGNIHDNPELLEVPR